MSATIGAQRFRVRRGKERGLGILRTYGRADAMREFAVPPVRPDASE